ncbi:DUF305 domain-containing protein [Microbacterium sp. CFBP9034]|uniref:DUF305 domain-containing protein n=1 Tax=Microbacterium sp. CFBP9034 TaxID=3096540 RepID=UPI002A6A9303|nr:DUF305 domain-containing protein [Microbacterium sp. CFBP9034]MDY0907906.1 DUF305 domain-containing protein [Microbacterium sp. CFBP9034]
MARPPRLLTLGAALVLTAVLSACTADAETPAPLPSTPVVQLGAPGEPNRTLSPEEAAALGSPEHIEADTVFVRDMLHHHAQAILMTGFVPDRTADEDIRMLAARMDTSQQDEMKQMEKWLQDRGEPVRDPDAAHDAHAGMPGLLTEAELAELEAAEGAEFDTLFLEYMIRHHEGAIAMVHELFEANGGQEPEIGVIARHVEADQEIEIERMKGMLAER